MFLGFDFSPPFDHPRQLKPGVCNPLGLTCYLTCKELIWSASSDENNVLIANNKVLNNKHEKLDYTFQPTLNPRGGVLPEKFGGGVQHAS